MTDTVTPPRGPRPGRMQLSPPRAAVPVAVPEPVVEPVVAATETSAATPEPAPAAAPATKVEPAAIVPRGRPVGRLRLSPAVPVAAPPPVAEVQAVPEPVEAAPEPTPEPEVTPAAPEPSTPPVEQAPVQRGPAPGRAHLSTPRVPAVAASDPVSVTRWREAVTTPLSELPPVEPGDEDDDLVLGEPDPVPPPALVEAAPPEPYVSMHFPLSRMRPHAVHGPKLPREGNPAFIGPPWHGDHSVPFH